MDVEHDSFKPYELTKLPIVQKTSILINHDCSKTLHNTKASLDGPICKQIAYFHSINVSGWKSELIYTVLYLTTAHKQVDEVKGWRPQAL